MANSGRFSFQVHEGRRLWLFVFRRLHTVMLNQGEKVWCIFEMRSSVIPPMVLSSQVVVHYTDILDMMQKQKQTGEQSSEDCFARTTCKWVFPSRFAFLPHPFLPHAFLSNQSAWFEPLRHGSLSWCNHDLWRRRCCHHNRRRLILARHHCSVPLDCLNQIFRHLAHRIGLPFLPSRRLTKHAIPLALDPVFSPSIPCLSLGQLEPPARPIS